MRFAIGFAVLLSSSCACWTAEHAQEPKCVVAHEIVDCTRDAMLSTIVPLFTDLLFQQGVDWNSIKAQITQRITAMGFKDGGCLLATLEADFIARARQQPTAAMASETAKGTQSINSLMTEWKKHHGVEGVRFKVIDSTGQEILR